VVFWSNVNFGGRVKLSKKNVEPQETLFSLLLGIDIDIDRKHTRALHQKKSLFFSTINTYKSPSN
jgi:hypothetical protein